MKRILYVHCVTSHIVNFHLPYLEAFKRNNYAVDVATNGNEIIDYCDRHFTVCFNQSPFSLFNFKALFELKKILDNNEYEFVILNGAIGGMIGRLASAITIKKIKVVYFVHGFPFFDGAPKFYNFFYKTLEKFLLKFTDILIVTNQDDCVAFYSFNIKKPIKFYYMPGVGIDSSKFLCRSPNFNVFRDDFGIDIKKNDFVMITAGEFTKRKNHMLLFEAMKKISDPDIKLLICGEGPLHEEYNRYIQKHNIRNIFFLGYCNNLSQLIANSDLFVFPSIREGLPIAIQIAMLNGTAVLASNIRGHNDLIIDKENGGLFKNIDELVVEIKHLKNNPQEMKLYSENSLKKIAEFDISKTLPIFENIFFGEEKN